MMKLLASAAAASVAIAGLSTLGASATDGPEITLETSDSPFVRITTMCQIPTDAPPGSQALVGGQVVDGDPGDYVWRIRQEEVADKVTEKDKETKKPTKITRTTYDFTPVEFATTHTAPITGDLKSVPVTAGALGDERVVYESRPAQKGVKVTVPGGEGDNINAYAGTASANNSTCTLAPTTDSRIVVRVFDDGNNDGDDKDDVDSAVQGATVTFSGGSLDQEITKTTGPNGYTSLRDIAPDEYSITVTLPDGSSFQRDLLPIDGVNDSRLKKIFTDQPNVTTELDWFQDRNNGTNQAWVRFSTVSVLSNGVTLTAGGATGEGSLTCFQDDTKEDCDGQSSQFLFTEEDDGATFLIEPAGGSKETLLSYLATLTFFGAGDVTLVGADDINASNDDLEPVDLCFGARAGDGSDDLQENEYCLLNKFVDGDSGDATFEVVFAGDPRFSFR